MDFKTTVCKYCGNQTPAAGVYCCMCGERLARKKREKGKTKYPKPRQLADGSLLGQIMVDGKRETVKAATEQEYRAKIDAYRHGVLEIREHPERQKLKTLLRGYIDANEGTLSPSTLRGYEIAYKNRFKAEMEKQVGEIDWQKAISAEAVDCSAKTVRNAWGLVAAAMHAKGIPVPPVNLPQLPAVDQDFLDYEQIKKFLAAIQGDPAEPSALLMLHSLRLSEALAVNAEDLQGETIKIRGAVVEDKNGKLVKKDTNKNKTSARDVPVLIERLRDLWPKEGPVVTMAPRDIRRSLEAACKKAGVPVCSPHDLRRSFASLAYHLGWPERLTQQVGGWGDTKTLRAVYYKLAGADVAGAVKSMQNYYGFTTEPKNDR